MTTFSMLVPCLLLWKRWYHAYHLHFLSRSHRIINYLQIPTPPINSNTATPHPHQGIKTPPPSLLIQFHHYSPSVASPTPTPSSLFSLLSSLSHFDAVDAELRHCHCCRCSLHLLFHRRHPAYRHHCLSARVEYNNNLPSLLLSGY